MKLKLSICIVLLVGSTGFGAEYIVTEIGAFRGDGLGQSVAYGINEAGVVVGSAQNNSGRYSPFVWTATGGLVNLDTNTVPAVNSYAVDVNDGGEIAGTVAPALSGTTYGFRSGGVGMTLMETLENGRDGQALGINSSGVVVGWLNEGGRCGGPECEASPGSAVKWVGTNVSKVGGLSGHFSVAYGINDAGEICGYGTVAGNNVVRAFRIPAGGAASDLGTLGGGSSRALAINNSGMIVGWAEKAENTNSHAALWAEGVIEDLGQLPGKVFNTAYAISDNGLIVGYSAGPEYADARAVFFRPGAAPTDLNSLIDPEGGWTLQFATGVNTLGQITAYGMHNGIRRGALLTPNLELRIARVSPGEVEVRWASFFVEYGIEVSGDVANWERAPAVPILQGNEFFMGIAIGTESKFFRLRRL